MSLVSPITTHVLDTSLGRPAAGIGVSLYLAEGEHDWKLVGQGITDSDGRLRDLLPAGSLVLGVYRLTFDTAPYFAAQNTPSFYPRVTIIFEVRDTAQHYHVPVLLSPFAYSTYRGS